MSQLKISVGPEDHTQGDDNADYTLVEYGDYECPHCGRAYPIVKQLQRHFGKNLRFGFRNFPLAQLHRQAESAAEAAEFAGSKGKFWEMHDLLYENQTQLGPALYEELAEQVGLSAQELGEALSTREFCRECVPILQAVFEVESTGRPPSLLMAGAMMGPGILRTCARRFKRHPFGPVSN